MRTEVKLSKRLERIASFVQPGSRVADIGTDHGYVPIWLVQKGVCPSALAMDVRKGPLERAEEHVEEVGLSGKIELRLSDGLAKLKAGEADTVGRKTDLPDSGTGTPCVGELERGKRTPDSVAAVGAGRSTLFSGRTGIFDSPGSDADGRGKILHSDRSGARHDAAGERAGLPFWSRFDPEERSGAACVSGERREDDAAGAGRADRK